jgi:hypothetical protein
VVVVVNTEENNKTIGTMIEQRLKKIYYFYYLEGISLRNDVVPEPVTYGAINTMTSEDEKALK